MLELGRRGLVSCGAVAGLTLCADGCGTGHEPARDAATRSTVAASTTPATAGGTPLARADDVQETPVSVERPGTGGTAFLVRSSGRILMLSATCTHAGCTVAWQASRREFVCPCHSGTYDPSGAVVSGPPPGPLEQVAVQVRGGQVYEVGG
jgi:cytochrome b6-f complex iron-sulfur subunit